MKRSVYICMAVAGLSCLFAQAQPVVADSHAYEKQLERGVKQSKAQDYQGAIATFTSVLRDFPNNYEAYLDRAEARKQIRDFAGALSDYDQAIKINPNVVEAYFRRGEIKEDRGDRKGAIDDYAQAVSLNPKDVEAISLLAQAYKRNGDYTKAADNYADVLKQQPASIQARKECADAKVKAGDYDGAAEDYRYLIKKYKQQFFNLHYELGQVLQLKGDTLAANDQFNEVINYYSKTVAHSKDKGRDYILLGLSHSQLGEQDKAIQELEQGVTLLPDDANARAQLGHIRLNAGDTAGAIKDLNDALRVDSNLTSALFDRGAAHLAEGDYAPAKSDLDAALAVRTNADGFLNRAMARLGLADTLGAEKDVRQAKATYVRSLDQRATQISDKLAKAGGKDANDPLAAQYLQQLALIDLAQNQLDSSESLVKRAIAIQEQKQKMSSSDIRSAVSMMLLGSINLHRHSMLKAEALFRTALTRLHNNPESSKYAVLGLEECAKSLIQSGNLEQAGSILADTRLQRSASGISEQVLTGDLGRQADRALEIYRKKKKPEKQPTLVSKPVEIASSIDPPKSRRVVETPVRDKWAVVIGISSFQDPSINLKYAAKDAQDFRDFLVKEKNFAPDHVELLTDKAATRANILSALGNKFLPRVAERNDLVIIYFSTHGSPSSLDIGGLNYLVAHDTDVNDLYATGIAMQDLARIIKARVHSERIMLVLDACHSGGAAPSSKGLSRSGNIDAEQLAQGTGQLVISSSEPDQVSWESKRYEGSVFTRHLIEGLRSKGEMTKLGDAFSHLQEEVEREVLRDRGAAQTPVIKSQWEGTDLVIGTPPAAPSPGLVDFGFTEVNKPVAPTHPKATAPSKAKP